MPKLRRQLDAKDLEQPADLVLDVDALIENGPATGEQHADMVALHALDVHLAVPATAQQLSDAPRIMLVRLVAHR